METKVVTTERWPDMQAFFEGHGNPNYCWCMTWRESSRVFKEMESAERKSAMQARVMAGEPVGLLAYEKGEPIAWCSVAPRSSYGRLERSRSIGHIDDRDVWSIVCLFITPHARGHGISRHLIEAAVEYAGQCGTEVVEAYPVEPERDEEGNWQPAKSYRFMGYRSSFEKAGFSDVTPPGSSRRIMRREVSEVR